MHIIDREGTWIPIEDLEGTIKLVKAFIESYSPVDDASLQRLEENRLAYWQDFYEKLLSLD